MQYKNYIITFDSFLVDDKIVQHFHETLINDPAIYDWWHYLEGTYIVVVKSGIDAMNITQFVIETMPEVQVLVSEINLRNHNGWLPDAAWEWINKYR